MKRTIDSPARLFKTKEHWAAWLDRHHDRSTGVWIRIPKKGSLLKSITYTEALEVALSHGWIDGQKRPEDAETWLQRFLPRSARSLWSRINREKAETLIAGGVMKPGGLAAVEQAKKAGRWECIRLAAFGGGSG